MIKYFPIFIIFILMIGSVNVYATTNQSTETSEPLTAKKTAIDKKEEINPTFFIGKKELKLLARLVHAEAKGEPFEGKVAVAKVVLNRMEHEQFPDTIEEVIYQKNAFEPVQNGSIQEPANEEARQAVKEAIKADEEEHDDILYFYNPDTATSNWIFSRQVVKKIGNHSFAI
ncbi:cell wall hydrolase [Bacillus sp. B15-48]|uniref:cell wall hydrolase n=1 Tax=Bacillus sp. B15-48 TaxID=1548601 RepID=UPI0019400890|nr:cell wall hydrolase [Bacillus sp. B15-48]MBM4763573.1 cell wall hydrolase [Bacillus sp. B15-48]